MDDLQDATERMRVIICASHDDLKGAIQQNQVPARARFRALRVAIGGIAFIAGAAVIAVDIYLVLGMATAQAVGSMGAGATAMQLAFEKLRNDLEGR